MASAVKAPRYRTGLPFPGARSGLVWPDEVRGGAEMIVGGVYGRMLLGFINAGDIEFPWGWMTSLHEPLWGRRGNVSLDGIECVRVG